jgi:hypothetical protein
MKINKMPLFSIFVSMLFALPVFAAEGVPGATIANDGAKPSYGARQSEACKADPEKCKAMKAKLEQRREACKADPEKCRQAPGACRCAF